MRDFRTDLLSSLGDVGSRWEGYTLVVEIWLQYECNHTNSGHNGPCWSGCSRSTESMPISQFWVAI
jgi:hypothetical protein